MHSYRTLRVLALSLITAVAANSHAYLLWDETVNGDLSNDRLNPTNVNLQFGDGSLFATTGAGDVDYLHIHLGAGLQLDSIVEVAWVGFDSKGFLAVQAGSTFTESSTNANVANLLGWTHYGPKVWNEGTDILPAMGSQGAILGLDGEAEGAGAIGFTPSLTGSDYTFWFNQTSTHGETYQLDFIASPEPAGIFSLLTGVTLLVRRNRRPR